MFKKWFYFYEAKSKHKYSSTHINLPQNLSRDIIDWGYNNVLETDISESPNDPGRETSPHVTVLYGIHHEVPTKIEKALEETKPFKIQLGKISLFLKNEHFDVLKINVISPKLNDLNRLFRKNINHNNDYPKYQPHITIAYIKKGKGKKYSGSTEFENRQFIAESVVFSSKLGAKNEIRLKR